MTEPLPHADRIGLNAGPWGPDVMDWPTDGYDGMLHACRYDDDDVSGFAVTGHTRDEWLALADMMIARWTAWRAHIASLPESP